MELNVASGRKILLGQLGRRGDCLYATTVARQIKHDYPDCNLTWAISSIYRSVIDHNPFVDNVWELQQYENDSVNDVWERFEHEAWKRKNNGEYDEVFLTQVHPGNYQNFDGTTRSSLFRGYPHPITVPINPVICLSENEVSDVWHFMTEHQVTNSDTVILFEAASTSGQSFVTPEFAILTAERVLQKNPKIKFIISSNRQIDNIHPHIIDGSTLTFRQNAEVTKYCTLLVGCSSGISWLSTSDWAKPLPQIQLLAGRTRMFASMFHDAKYFNLPTDNFIELVDVPPGEAAEIVLLSVRDGFAKTFSRYQTTIPVKFDFYFSQIYNELISKRQYNKTSKALSTASTRYRYDDSAKKRFQYIIRNILTPYLHLLWWNLTDEDRRAFIALGCGQPHGLYWWQIAKSFSQLCVFSFWGENVQVARLFLLDRIGRFIKIKSPKTALTEPPKYYS